MKKHDEGYALLLVVVVILVLGIMSAALMSLTVTNLKNQRNSVTRMQEKYAAQGELEKVVASLGAQIDAKLEEIPEGQVYEVPPISDATDDSAYPIAALNQWIEEIELEDKVKPNSIVISDESFSFVIPLSAISESGKTQIDVTLTLSGTIKQENVAEGEDETETDFVKSYKIEFGKLQYASYDIIEIEGGAGE